MSNLKVKGKAKDWCIKCRNCKSTTKECDGKKDWLTEIECEDPYDGVVKILSADSDICCSMFKTEAGRYPWEKCERSELESKIKEIIKASKRKDELIQDYRERLKKVNNENNLLNSKFDKLRDYYITNENLIDNIQKVIFPQEEGSDYAYSYEEILNKVKDLKVQSDENGNMYEDLKCWRERCHDAENENISLSTINKGLAEDLRAAKDKLNYLYFKAKEFADKEESDDE